MFNRDLTMSKKKKKGKRDGYFTIWLNPNEIEGGRVDMREKYEEKILYIGKVSPVSIPG
jgi:hypothetical protein